MSQDEIHIGDRVIANGKTGTIKYIGKLEVAPGNWGGVDLDEPLGKHNGTFNGKTYFVCEDKHGCFVKMDLIKKSPPPEILEKIKRKGSLPSSNAGSDNEDNSPNIPRPSTSIPSKRLSDPKKPPSSALPPAKPAVGRRSEIPRASSKTTSKSELPPRKTTPTTTSSSSTTGRPSVKPSSTSSSVTKKDTKRSTSSSSSSKVAEVNEIAISNGLQEVLQQQINEKDKECNELKNQLNELMKQNNELQFSVDNCKNVISEYEKEIDELKRNELKLKEESEKEKENNDNDDSLMNNDESNSIITSLYNRISGYETEISQFKKEKNEMVQKIKQLEYENGEKEEENKRINEEKQSLLSKYQKLELSNANFKSLEEKSEEFDRIVGEKDVEINELKIKLEELSLEKEEIEFSKEEIETKYEILQNSLSEGNTAQINIQIVEELERYKTENRNLKEENEMYKEQVQVSSSYEDIIEGLTNDKLTLEEQLQDLDTQLKTVEEYRDIQDQMEEEYIKYKNQLENTIREKDIEIQEMNNNLILLDQSVVDRDNMIQLYINKLNEMEKYKKIVVKNGLKVDDVNNSNSISEDSEIIMKRQSHSNNNNNNNNIVNEREIKKYENKMDILSNEIEILNVMLEKYYQLIPINTIKSKFESVDTYFNVKFGNIMSERILKFYDISNNDLLNKLSPKLILNEYRSYHDLTKYYYLNNIMNNIFCHYHEIISYESYKNLSIEINESLETGKMKLNEIISHFMKENLLSYDENMSNCVDIMNEIITKYKTELNNNDSVELYIYSKSIYSICNEYLFYLSIFPKIFSSIINYINSTLSPQLKNTPVEFIDQYEISEEFLKAINDNILIVKNKMKEYYLVNDIMKYNAKNNSDKIVLNNLLSELEMIFDSHIITLFEDLYTIYHPFNLDSLLVRGKNEGKFDAFNRFYYGDNINDKSTNILLDRINELNIKLSNCADNCNELKFSFDLNKVISDSYSNNSDELILAESISELENEMRSVIMEAINDKENIFNEMKNKVKELDKFKRRYEILQESYDKLNNDYKIYKEETKSGLSELVKKNEKNSRFSTGDKNSPQQNQKIVNEIVIKYPNDYMRNFMNYYATKERFNEIDETCMLINSFEELPEVTTNLMNNNDENENDMDEEIVRDDSEDDGFKKLKEINELCKEFYSYCANIEIIDIKDDLANAFDQINKNKVKYSEIQKKIMNDSERIIKESDNDIHLSSNMYQSLYARISLCSNGLNDNAVKLLVDSKQLTNLVTFS